MGNRGIADFLNVNGIKTVRGRVFTATLVGMKKWEIRERMWILNQPDTRVIEEKTIYYKNEVPRLTGLPLTDNGESAN